MMNSRLIPFLLLLSASCADAKDKNEGWFEITPSGAQKQFPVISSTSDEHLLSEATQSGAIGDKLYISRSGDTLEKIALVLTGSSANSVAIAAYNGLLPTSTLKSESLLFVPAALLLDKATSNTTAFEIQEFVIDKNDLEINSDQTDSPAVRLNALPAESLVKKSDLARPTKLAYDVKTQNVDMFSGEVKVLGRVAVKRVAVGNGEIVRAEVLSSGELLVIAQSPGSTSLRLWHIDRSQSDYNIRVSEEDTETRFKMERMVRMKVRMVEFRKSELGRLGIDWSDSAAGPTFATAGDAISNSLYRPTGEAFANGLPNSVRPFSTYFGIASNITSRINFLASSGDAVTLAEPVLSCANGGNASFLAGGEVPYPTTGANGQTTVQFKEYGIRLNISPQIDTAGNVRTLIDTEISQLDPAVSVQGAPGLLTRRTQTQVNVRSGETIVISGLLSAEQSKDIDKLPGIGNLPILGSLFQSRNTRNAVSELVIFVTPEVIDPAGNSLSSRNSDIYDKTNKRVVNARGALPLME